LLRLFRPASVQMLRVHDDGNHEPEKRQDTQSGRAPVSIFRQASRGIGSQPPLRGVDLYPARPIRRTLPLRDDALERAYSANKVLASRRASLNRAGCSWRAPTMLEALLVAAQAAASTVVRSPKMGTTKASRAENNEIGTPRRNRSFDRVGEAIWKSAKFHAAQRTIRAPTP